MIYNLLLFNIKVKEQNWEEEEMSFKIKFIAFVDKGMTGFKIWCNVIIAKIGKFNNKGFIMIA
jgi:hypothetical protein